MNQVRKVILVVNLSESILLFRLSLLVDLKKNGCDVEVFSPIYDVAVASELAKHGIEFRQIKMNRTGVNPFNELITLIDIYRLFKNKKPDVVLNYTLKPIIYSSFAAYLTKVPFIASMLTGFGSIFLGTELKTKLIRLLVKPLFRMALKCNNKIFALNPDIIRVFTKLDTLDINKTVLINGEGLDIDYYHVEPLPQSSEPIFLIITRLIRDKGIYEYVEAAKIIKRKHPKTRFLIVGYLDINPTALTKKELDKLLADGVVEYLGKLEDVRAVIAQSSVYVLPSYGEGMPRSILEAMAMGRPIITTDVPGCRETVVDSKNGFLVPVKNVEKLSEAMERFILNPDIIPGMGKESRRMAEEKYDVRKVNQVILKTIGII